MSKLTLPPAVCTFSMTVRPLPARFRSKLPVPLKFGWLARQRRDQRLERDAARAAVEREPRVVARGAHVEVAGERAAVELRARVLELQVAAADQDAAADVRELHARELQRADVHRAVEVHRVVLRQLDVAGRRFARLRVARLRRQVAIGVDASTSSANRYDGASKPCSANVPLIVVSSSASTRLSSSAPSFVTVKRVPTVARVNACGSEVGCGGSPKRVQQLLRRELRDAGRAGPGRGLRDVARRDLAARAQPERLGAQRRDRQRVRRGVELEARVELDHAELARCEVRRQHARRTPSRARRARTATLRASPRKTLPRSPGSAFERAADRCAERASARSRAAPRGPMSRLVSKRASSASVPSAPTSTVGGTAPRSSACTRGVRRELADDDVARELVAARQRAFAGHVHAEQLGVDAGQLHDLRLRLQAELARSA